MCVVGGGGGGGVVHILFTYVFNFLVALHFLAIQFSAYEF